MSVCRENRLQRSALLLPQPGVRPGGARPKAFLQTYNGPGLIKFSELDDTVDIPLIEYATTTLASTQNQWRYH